MNSEAAKKIKVSKEKRERFENLLVSLLASGHDITMWDGQTRVGIYLDEPYGYNIMLNVNGTWSLE